MKFQDTVKTTPINVPRSLRKDYWTGQTSCKAGQIMPVAYVPLLREDRVSRANFTVTVEMMETPEMLMNGVNVRVEAHLIPHLAAERFGGSMDTFDRSWENEQLDINGGIASPDFFVPWTFDETAEIIQALGIHGVQGQPMPNNFVIEAYNALVNWMRAARSEKITKRGLLDTTLAEAFWRHDRLRHIVPSFEQAMIDGEVPLVVNPHSAPVSGIGIQATGQGSTAPLRNSFPNVAMIQTGTGAMQAGQAWVEDGTIQGGLAVLRDPGGLPLIFANISGQNATLSLANIEAAKKTAAFAKVRSQFSKSVTDDHVIDMLMNGLRVQNEQLKDPILLDRADTIIGYSRRYATDGANLSKSATNGMTEVDIGWVTPPIPTGGLILITAQIVPDQLFERQQDAYLFTSTPDEMPQYLRDELDTEKVEVVKNGFVDVRHTQADQTFGYAPLNHRWKRDNIRLGGKYYKPSPTAPFDEDRQKVWTNDKVDPTLTDDFYICSDLHHNVFADTQADAFEIGVKGSAEIVGLTVFGKGLVEDNGHYDAVQDELPTDKIDQS